MIVYVLNITLLIPIVHFCFFVGTMTLMRTPCELDKMSLFQDLKLKRRKVDSRCSSDGELNLKNQSDLCNRKHPKQTFIKTNMKVYRYSVLAVLFYCIRKASALLFITVHHYYYYELQIFIICIKPK